MRGYRSQPDGYLFNKGDWHATQEGWKNELVSKIGAMNGDELLNISTTDLAGYYVDEYTFEVPVIHPDELVVDQRETKIDVSQDRNRIINDRSRPFHITGTTIDVEVPFTGNKVAFDIQPSTRNFNNPKARVREGIIEFSVTGTDLSAERVKQEIERVLDSINTHLGWLANDAKGYNAGLENLATQTIERRKEKLLKDKSLVAGLGFKIKERPGATETFAAPKVQRNIRARTPKPTASRAAYNPEPILTDDDYEHILSVLANMVSVMEQSPGAFREIDEESLRTHFLMQLNGHFLGDATGETFNYEGKTDILIKVDGRNIFIGECKFWTGEKGYLETLDQVLSYLSWRDTKAAVLIFSRNKDFTGVLEKIEEGTHKHPNCKSWLRNGTKAVGHICSDIKTTSIEKSL
jgi:hypothetical protein